MNSTLTSPNPFTPFLKPSSFNFSSSSQSQNTTSFTTGGGGFTVISSHINKVRVFHKLPTTAGLYYTEQRQDNKVLISNVITTISKPIAFTVFWIVIGLCPIRGVYQKPAIAATVTSEVVKTNRGKNKGVSYWKDHEFSEFTRRLLETVSGLIRVIEEVRSGNGDLENVEVALKDVKLKKQELQGEVLSRLYAELRDLKVRAGKKVGGDS